MAENSQGKKYGHEINFHGPYLDGQINLTFHVVSSSNDQITTIKEIADLIREDGTIPATGNYTYYEKQEENNEVEKTKETEDTKDEASGATPRPIMKTVIGIQVDGDGIKPIFAKEENSIEPRIMTMSVDSVSATDDTVIYPTILSADAPAVLADTSDDSKLLTFGNLKAFATLTDTRYVQLKQDDPAPGSYATSTDLSTLEGQVIKKGTINVYQHYVRINMGNGRIKKGQDHAYDYRGDGIAYVLVVNNSSDSINSETKLKSAISGSKNYFMVGHFKPDSGELQYLYSFSKNTSVVAEISSYNFTCSVWPADVGTFYFNLSSTTTSDIVVPIVNV